MKKTVSVVLIVAMILSLCFQAMASENYEFTIDPNAYDSIYGSISENKPSIGMNLNTYAEYTLTAEITGTYEIYATVAAKQGNNSQLTAYIDEISAGTGTFTGNDWYEKQEVFVGSILLKGGSYKLRMKNTGSNALRLRGITIKVTPATEDEIKELFLEDIREAQTADDVQNILGEYSDYLPYDEYLSELFYRRIVDEELTKLSFDSMEETDALFHTLYNEEKANPLVTVIQNGESVTTPGNGDFTVNIAPRFVEELTAVAAIYAYVDGVEIGSVYVESSDKTNVMTVGYVSMTAGDARTFSFENRKADIDDAQENTGKPRLDIIKLTEVPALTLDSVSIAEGSTVGRSTDVITLDYSRNLDADELDNATVTLGDIALDLQIDEADASKLNIILRETLDYAGEYTLTFSGITDEVGYVTEEETVTFKTYATDEGSVDNSTAEISVELEDSTFTVSGNVYGSAGQTIAGRDVEISVTTPLENDTKVIDTLTTDENGSFELTYELPEDYVSVGGEYTFTAFAEHTEVPATDTKRYISEEDKITLLGNLEDADAASDVATFFTTGTNAVDLGADIASLDSLGNVSLFYDRLAKASYKNDDDKYDLSVFEQVWKIAYALETIGQLGKGTEGYFEDADFSAAIGLDTERYALLDTQKSAFIADVPELVGTNTAIEFGKKVNALINEYLLKENNKTDLTLTLSDETVYVGKIAKVTLALTEKAEDVSEYIVEVTCPSKDSASKVSLTAPDGAKVTKTVDGSVVSLAVTDVSGKTEDLGTLEYSSSSATSEEFTVGGSAVYDIDGLVLDCDIISDKTTITVKSNSSKGGSGSTTGRVSVSGTSNVPVVSTPEETQASFTDLSDASWAEQYIVSLTKKGVITVYADGRFRPNESITRADFVIMLVSALRLIPNDMVVKFNDVSTGDQCYQAVSAAVGYGLVMGDDKGNFCPNDTITRQDMCVIMSRAMDKLGYGMVDAGELFYDDIEISSYAKEAVYRMRHHGIVNGIGDGTFAPLSDASRAATAKIIDTFMKEANI